MNARLDLAERTLALNFHAADKGALLAGLTGGRRPATSRWSWAATAHSRTGMATFT